MLKSTKLITNNSFKAPITEAYKTLRTNIQFSSADKPIKTILVTSSGPGEGKSTTASNLAITMAESEKRVLLLDCDFRKPSIHRAFNLVNAKGVTNILAEGIDYQKITNDVGVPNLEVITSGPKPPNPSELLGSSKMKAFVEKACESYDIIILDTPPIVPVTDAAVLSRLVDGVILVTSYGQVTYDQVVKAKENLMKVDANILGVVMNRIPSKGSQGYYYYYYYGDGGEKGKRRHRRTDKGLGASGSISTGVEE